MASTPIIAVTSGEPAGIGPDICLALAKREFPARIVVLGERGLLGARARALGAAVDLRDFDPAQAVVPGVLDVLHVPLAAACRAGVTDPANARYVLALLDRAADGCLAREFAAMVTAPVDKGVISSAGIAFTGHTEYLARRTGCEQVVMMLVGGGMRVALATTHLALKDVPGAITREGLERTIRILVASLSRLYGIARPRILVTGLNPHCGEAGYLGREEIEVIAPVLEKLRAGGFSLRGPLAADTLFSRANLRQADCVLAMYHDQGLPVLKFASFGAGVNVTLGLPIIRTSVDHGTATALAGTGKADPGSLLVAVEAAIEMARVSAASS
ncbi:MAG: 4-hydroxythreonine-4-phosphate dehydrogenase PdxA [Betaproteobacteria bacterium]|nr:4-hydroxythreonine-4-phosphate dehydrogenase PdxA [Betaproteobacteria bacterium]